MRVFRRTKYGRDWVWEALIRLDVDTLANKTWEGFAHGTGGDVGAWGLPVLF